LPALAADRWDSLDQRDELGYVVAVAAGGDMLSFPAARKPCLGRSAKLISGGARCLVMFRGAIRPFIL